MQEGMAFTPQLASESESRRWLWLVPAVPMLAAGVIALLKQPMRKTFVGAGDWFAWVFAAGGAGCVWTCAERVVAWSMRCAKW